MGLFKTKTSKDLTEEQALTIAKLACDIDFPYKSWEILKDGDYIEMRIDINKLAKSENIDDLYVVIFSSLGVAVYLGEDLRATLNQHRIYRLFRKWRISPTKGGADHPSFIFNYRKYKDE